MHVTDGEFVRAAEQPERSVGLQAKVQVPIEASSIRARTPRATKSALARKWAKPIGFSMVVVLGLLVVKSEG